jgi:hypothetical protein
MPQMKEWTLMFYFASDNPLAPSIIPQLKSIKQAGFHQQVNVIAQFDPQPEGTPTHIFDVNLVNKLKAGDTPQVGFSGRSVDDPFVSNLIEDKLWRDQLDRNGERSIRDRLRESLEKSKPPVIYDPPVPPPHTKLRPVAGDNGSETDAASAAFRTRGRNRPRRRAREEELNPMESLGAFLKFCAEKYPARHYILFILGHGIVVGNDIFLFDENADEQSLSLKGLGDVLNGFRGYLRETVPGAEFELASFHSCSVSSLEVAYELQGTANYMLASQGPAFVGSWPYRQILIRLFKDTDDLRKLEAEEEQERDKEKKEALRQKIGAKLADTFRKFTDYCFHNNKDFLFAGYSFDVTLCDLRNVSGYFTEAVVGLRGALEAALLVRDEKDYPLLRNLIQLAHLEAQSEWQESYTDLHDFCFCLRRQCETFKEALGTRGGEALGETLTKLDNISTACNVVIGKFPIDDGDRRIDKTDESVILRSEFLGPDHQYTHGLSVYFPWSRPLSDRLILSDYAEYEFNAKTGWLDFLLNYFGGTQRRSRLAEINDELKRRETEADGDKPRSAASRPAPPQSPEDELSEDIASLVFNDGGVAQLSGENSLATLEDKVNPKDRTGDSCACASIKNYPRDTRDLKARQQTAAKPREGDVYVPASQSQALLPGNSSKE